MSENENKEVPEETLKQKLGETTELLKRKIVALQEKNKALLVKLKDQAIAVTKEPITQGRSFIESVMRFFEGVPNKPRLIVMRLGDEYIALAGTPSKQRFKDGLMLLEDSSTVNYDMSSGNVELLNKVGSCYICKQNIFMVMDLPQ